MKIIFAGTPDFAVPSLQALIDSQHEIVAVYTQPDRPKGRGQQLTASPIKQLALQHHLPIEQPASLKTQSAQQTLINYDADLMVVAAYGLLLPNIILTAPKYGCINVHASLLPRWRGASPIQHAILHGDSVTGITIMQMNTGLDKGDMLLQKSCAIADEDTSQTLQNKLAVLGASALSATLPLIEKQQLKPQQQNETLVTYAPKITKQQAKINWQHDAFTIARQVRGFNPWPMAFCEYQGQPLRIWQADAINTEAAPPVGNVLTFEKGAILVACAKGILAITKLQIAGGKPMRAQDFINGLKEKSHDIRFN